MKPYYETELGKLYHGDCLGIMPKLEPIDLILADPPYDKEAHTSMRRTRASIEHRKAEDKIPFDVLSEADRKRLIDIAKESMPKWGLFFCQAETVGKYYKLCGDTWRRSMVWIKPDSAPQFSGDRPAMGYESICAAWFRNGKSSWNGGGKRGVFTHLCTNYKHLHPTQKPISLICELVNLFSNSGDVVCDPMAGSGTTGIACERLNRKYILIEKELEYCEISKQRIENEIKQLKMF